MPTPRFSAWRTLQRVSLSRPRRSASSSADRSSSSVATTGCTSGARRKPAARSAPPARTELRQREQRTHDRRLEKADPFDDLAAEPELEVLDAGEGILRAFRQPPHVVAPHAELSHPQQRAPLQEVERPRLRVRAAPAAEELPRAIGDAHHEEGAGVLVADARDEQVHALAERVAQRPEISEVVDREAVALADDAQDPVEALEVRRLLGGDALTLRLADVLPRLSAHRRKQLVRLARGIEEKRAARLHEHGRPRDAGLGQRRTERAIVRLFGIADEGQRAMPRGDGAERADRRGQVGGLADRTARRVGHGEPARAAPDEELRQATTA